ncbi:MAG: DMT family transporter [Lachnospiraceae bacterium]|nr:DMT family transporter [Lachnospiraceae bacterium]
MTGIIIALISGALMSIQGVFNTGVTKQTSLWVANSFVQFTGFLLCLLIWIIKERDHSMVTLLKVEPKYLLLGGLIGAGITMTVIQSMDRLGPAKAVMLIVISQIIIAYLIELFGLFGVEKVPFQWSKLIGAGITIIGIIVFKFQSS